MPSAALRAEGIGSTLPGTSDPTRRLPAMKTVVALPGEGIGIEVVDATAYRNQR